MARMPPGTAPLEGCGVPLRPHSTAQRRPAGAGRAEDARHPPPPRDRTPARGPGLPPPRGAGSRRQAPPAARKTHASARGAGPGPVPVPERGGRVTGDTTQSPSPGPRGRREHRPFAPSGPSELRNLSLKVTADTEPRACPARPRRDHYPAAPPASPGCAQQSLWAARGPGVQAREEGAGPLSWAQRRGQWPSADRAP